MAWRYYLTSEPERVRDHFAYHNDEQFPPRDEIAPTEPVMIVRRGHDGRRQAVLVRWGLIPAWVRDFDKLGTLSTARVETVGEKPSFRGAMRHKRCLIPADGFFMSVSGSAARVSALADQSDGGRRPLLGFAGLYEDWMGADGSEIDSMAIITQPVSTTLSAYGARMPVILPPEHYADWLDCRGVTADEAEQLLLRGALNSLEVIEDIAK